MINKKWLNSNKASNYYEKSQIVRGETVARWLVSLRRKSERARRNFSLEKRESERSPLEDDGEA